MFTIDSNQTIAIKLTAAVTAFPVNFSAAFLDGAANGSNSFVQRTNAETTLVGSPLVGKTRQITGMIIVNLDTATTNVTVSITNGINPDIVIAKLTLLTGQSATYESGTGWTVYNSSGTPINQFGSSSVPKIVAGATYTPISADFGSNTVVELTNNGAIVITMPDPSTVPAYQLVRLKLMNQTASMTVNASVGGEDIDGKATGGQTIAAAGGNFISGKIGLYTDGTDWFTL